MKQLSIGEVGKIWGVKVEVKEFHYTDSCELCAFSLSLGYTTCPHNKCEGKYRKDKKQVYFKEVKP